MLTGINKQDCCGCSACKQICPNHCIQMLADEQGFLYPHIDEVNCNKCGLCKATCPKGWKNPENFDCPEVYAVKHNIESIRLSSSSGGIFTALSDYVLENGGIVFGVGLDKDMRVVHKKASSKQERDTLKGSKYVQSDIGNAFLNVKDSLEKGIPVLFTGTPCQVAGLMRFLKRDYINLFTCDLICHGTPSPLLYADYIERVKKKLTSEIIDISFRSKKFGWHNPTIVISLKDGREIYIDNSYLRLFQQDIILREACYSCIFSSIARPSDITIGDFWGIEKHKPHFDDDKGVSLVLVNTAKGRRIFEIVRKDCINERSDISECMQHNLQSPTIPSPDRAAFWKDYHLRGFDYAAKKYSGESGSGRLKRTVIVPILQKIGLLGIVRKMRNNFRR